MCTFDDRLQVRHLQRRDDEIPVAEDHRRACAAEQERRAEEARDRHHLRRSARRRDGLREQRDGARENADGDDDRTDRGEHAADRRPVQDERPLRTRRSAPNADAACEISATLPAGGMRTRPPRAAPPCRS